MVEVKAGYKKTELGVIPDNWLLKPLGSMFSISAGGDFDKRSSNDFQNESYPFPIYSNAVTNKGLYGFSKFCKHKAGSITVTARGTLGFTNYRDHDYTAIGRALVLEPNETLDGRFVSEFINNRITFVVESTGVPQLTAPQISKYLISIPSDLSEQKAIAQTLADVDFLITSLEKLIAKKRDIKTATMQQLLTGKKRLPEFGEGKGYKDTDIGRIPEDWDVFGLNQVLNGISDVDHYMPKTEKFGIPYVMTGDLKELAGDIDFDNCKKISKTAYKKLSKKVKNVKGDIILARYATVGTVAYVNIDFDFIVSYSCVNIKADTSKLLGLFLYYYFKSNVFKLEVRNKVNANIQDNVGISDLFKMNIPLPPNLPEQKAIAQVLSDMDTEITQLESRLDKTKAIKHGMMQELLTGRTRLV